MPHSTRRPTSGRSSRCCGRNGSAKPPGWGRRLGEIQAGLVLTGLVIGDSDEKKEPPLRVTAATSPAPAGVAVPATPALPRRARDTLPPAGPGSNVQPAAGPDVLRRVLDGLNRL
ncbi:MAG TPA: hypothetical protein VF933_27645 [Streptosporangiaceae bacterium]